MSLTSLSDIRTGEVGEIAKKAEIPFSLLPTPTTPATSWAASPRGCPHHRIKSRYTGVCRLSGQRSGHIGRRRCAGGAMSPSPLLAAAAFCYIGSEPIYDKRLLNCRSPYQGLYTILQTTDNAGISLRWFRDVFGDAVQQKAEAAGLSICDYMNTLAEKGSAGCNGLVYLPLSGR
ncbi:MAG: hypothetical protein ACLVES_04220 [Faecalibacterium prausnitzii]